MAYKNTTERVSEIREKLKKEFPYYKFSITKSGSGNGVNIYILSAPIDLMVNKEEKYVSVNNYYIKENYKDYPEVRDALLKINEIASEGVKYYETGDYGNQPDFYVWIYIGKWDKPFEYTPNKFKKTATPTTTTQSNSNWSRGELLRECSGWKVYKKRLPDGRIVYNAVKDKETAPNKGDWNAIKGEIYIETGFKWGRFGAFEKWGEITESRGEQGVLDALCDILNKYYKSEETTTQTTTQKGLTISDVVSKLNWSEGLKQMMIEDFKKSGYEYLGDLIASTETETSQNIQDRIIGFSSGKHTYLQANMIAKVIFENKEDFKYGKNYGISSDYGRQIVQNLNRFGFEILENKNNFFSFYKNGVDLTLDVSDNGGEFNIVNSVTKDFITSLGYISNDIPVAPFKLAKEIEDIYLSEVKDTGEISIYIDGEFIENVESEGEALVLLSKNFGSEKINEMKKNNQIQSITDYTKSKKFKKSIYVLRHNFYYGKKWGVPEYFGNSLQFQLSNKGFKIFVSKNDKLVIYKTSMANDGIIITDNNGEFILTEYGDYKKVAGSVNYEMDKKPTSIQTMTEVIMDIYENYFSNKKQEPTNETKKEQIQKAIAGLQILADKGNEKAQKAIIGLQYLLNK